MGLLRWTKSMVALCALLVGCGEVISGSRVTPGEGPRTFQCRELVQSRDYSQCTDPHHSNPADLSYLQQDDIQVSDYFEKPYDRADLTALLISSTSSSGRYIEGMGVSLYRAQVDQINGCPSHFSLPTAPVQVQCVWDEVNQEIASGGGKLAGLYFEYPPRQPDSREVRSPTILVREDTDRWTLVHEMMHHNFNVARKRDPNYLTHDELRAAISHHLGTSSALLDQYNLRPESATLLSAAQELRRLFEAVYQFSVRKDFEEVAIESLLLDEAAAGHLRLITLQSLKDAVWYIEYSRDTAKLKFGSILESMQRIREIALQRDWPNVVEESDRVFSRYMLVNRRVREVAERARQQAERARVQLGDPEAETFSPFESDRLAAIHAAQVIVTHPHNHVLGGFNDFAQFEQPLKDLASKAAEAASR